MKDGINSICKTFETLEEVRAIGLVGGSRPFPQPGEGDLDIVLYCSHLPRPEQRARLLRQLSPLPGKIRMDCLNGGHWGSADVFTLNGVETWMLYFTIVEAMSELEAILAGAYPARVDGEFFPIGRCAMLQDMLPLFDPDGVIERLKGYVACYPEGLAKRQISYHLAHLRDDEDLERAVQRKDVLFYHFALDNALDHFLLGLFALNRTFFPSRKRSLEFLDSFSLQPAFCSQRLLQVIELGNQEENLGRSWRVWQSLVSDLGTLARATEGKITY